MRVFVVLLAAVAPAVAAAAVLEHVDVSLEPTPTVRLTLSESEPAGPTGHTLAANGTLPPRFYIDLAGTRLAPEVVGTVAGGGPLLRVRTGQFDRSTARVVVDLANAMPLTVRTEGRIVTIELEPAASASEATPAAEPVVTHVVTPPPPLAGGPSRPLDERAGEREVAIEALATPSPPLPAAEAERPSTSEATPAPAPVVTHVVTPPPPLASGPSRPRDERAGEREVALEASPTPSPPVAVAEAERPSTSTPVQAAPPPVQAAPPPAAKAAPLPPVQPAHPAPAKPASRPPVVASAQTPRAVVVVDAGHGGRDPGAAGIGGVLEKDIVLEFARLLAAKLSARLPVDTLLTRSDDSFVSLTRRLPAPGSHAALFLSLHANACSDPELRGVELFYGGGPLRPASTGGAASPQAVLLGRLLVSALRAQIGEVRGPRAGGFRVLTSNPVPSALIEIGYLTHRGDAELAQDVAYREALTDAVVAGVASFLHTTAPRL